MAARQRAAEDQRPHAITRNADEDDIAAHGIETASRGFYSLQKFRYTHRRFDGINSPLLTREILTSGDAVIVLPYDPERGEVVLIEQMRPAALARGSSDAWGLEAVAGLIGYGETPEYTALRELEEEAGLSARALYTLAASYPSPGSLSQYMYSFIAHVDLSGYEAGVFGLASEAEDIRTHVVSLSTARDLLASGEINIMPLQYCLQALLLDKEKIDIEFNGQ